jgi:hypothetical protein
LFWVTQTTTNGLALKERLQQVSRPRMPGTILWCSSYRHLSRLQPASYVMRQHSPVMFGYPGLTRHSQHWLLRRVGNFCETEKRYWISDNLAVFVGRQRNGAVASPARTSFEADLVVRVEDRNSTNHPRPVIGRLHAIQIVRPWEIYARSCRLT